MADPTVTPAAMPTVAPEERGTLEVRTKALEHLAERAALEAPGTVAHRGSLRGLLGGNVPHAEVTTSGQRVRVVLDVAVTWPADVARVAAGVRDHVLSRSSELGGVGVTSVDVTVHLVTPQDSPRERRVQ